VDSIILDVSLISFIVLVIGLMVIPERGSAAVVTEAASAAS
jgi:hypothetical protein